jgi:hypothetical protein
VTSRLGRYLRFPWRSTSRLRCDLDEELRFYCDMRTRELMEQGMSDADARREAVREFGDVEYTKRYCLAEDAMSSREERRTDVIAELRQDIAHSWRTFRRSPGFAAVALITLALGIGANTAIFSVVNGLLLRDLPFGDPDRLVRVGGAHKDSGADRSQLSAGDFIDLRTRQRSFATLGALPGAAARTSAPATRFLSRAHVSMRTSSKCSECALISGAPLRSVRIRRASAQRSCSALAPGVAFSAATAPSSERPSISVEGRAP